MVIINKTKVFTKIAFKLNENENYQTPSTLFLKFFSSFTFFVKRDSFFLVQ